MNTGYPGAAIASHYAANPRHCPLSNDVCLAYNYGFNAAGYALLYAASQNAHSTVWWLDVETENSWSANHQTNRAALLGMIDAIKRNTIFSAIGIYSTPLQWKHIMGDWHNGLPNWVGTGSTGRSVAIATCHGSNFTGGGTLLAQYTRKLDRDYVCGNSSVQLVEP